MAKDFTDPDYVIRVQVMQERDATIVSLGTDYATVKGSARRDPQDKHDPEVAYALAASRALEKLATRYRKRAQGRMNTLENNRKQAEAAALKKTRTDGLSAAFCESVMAPLSSKVVAEYGLSDGRVLTVYLNGSTKLSGAPQS